MPGEARGHEAFTVHLISVLDRFRFIRTLLPRVELGKVANIVAKQFYDTQRSQDLIIQCAPLPPRRSCHMRQHASTTLCRGAALMCPVTTALALAAIC